MVKLTLDLVVQKCKTDNLSKIKKLDVWSSELEEVALIREMPNLEICSLSLNQITSLKYFGHSQNLSELYLRKNHISDLFEIKHLQGCAKLKVLWLWDNPIALHPLYRQYVIKHLPNLVKLDNTPVSPEEKLEC
jgi:Leucine-rich repeat (LRR) protein